MLLRETSSSMRVLLLFAGLALGLTMMPELMHLRLDIGRQNTVFKLYFMGWLLFSIVGGRSVCLIVERASVLEPCAAFGLVDHRSIFVHFGGRLSHPGHTRSRAAQRFDPLMPISLDGLEFMRYAKHWDVEELFPLEPDYQIIRWLLENVEGAPVIMEGPYLWQRISLDKSHFFFYRPAERDWLAIPSATTTHFLADERTDSASRCKT